MIKPLKNKKRIYIGIITITLITIVIFIPKTSIYQNVVERLWNIGVPKEILYTLNINDSDLSIKLGNYYFTGPGYDLGFAVRSYKQAIKINQSIKTAHYQLGRIYFIERKFDQAIVVLNAEMEIDPYNRRPLYMRGLVNLYQVNLPNAEKDFADFVAWTPGEWGGYNDLAFTLAKEGKFKESEKVAQAGIQNTQNGDSNPWLVNSLALAEINQGRYNEASISFSKALLFAEKITPAVWRRAYSGNNSNTDTESIAGFQNAIRSNLKIAQQGI